MRNTTSSIWDGRDLVIFDLDGTLYDQTRLRAHMALSLCADAMRSRTLETLKVLRRFRACREMLAMTNPDDFTERQFADTAVQCGRSKEEVEQIVGDWMERRPLVFLAACRYPGIELLFEELRKSGRMIAIFSDYPAREKLHALDLEADVVVSAMDDDVRRLKPDPAGLDKILRITGVPASRALMVGDRFDRDWAVANRIGMDSIIRSARTDPRCATFRSYNDALFEPVIGDAGWDDEEDGELALAGSHFLPNREDCIAAITDTLIRLERPDTDETAVAPAAAYITATQDKMPDYVRLGFHTLTLAFDAWSLPRTGKPFHRLDLDRRAEQVRRWENSRLSFRQALIAFYRSFAMFGLQSELCNQDTDCGARSKPH